MASVRENIYPLESSRTTAALISMSLLAFLFGSTTHWVGVAEVPLARHVATSLWAIFPILIAGTLHMAVVKDDLLGRFARPIHERWFGGSKTWRGVVSMTAFSILGVYALVAFGGAELDRGTVDFHRHPAWLLGALLGLAFIVAELPNSFLKRRLGIPPGGRSERFGATFVLIDQLDSVIGCGLLYVLACGMPWQTFCTLLPVAVLVLLLVKRTLFHLGLKRSPA